MNLLKYLELILFKEEILLKSKNFSFNFPIKHEIFGKFFSNKLPILEKILKNCKF